ncbi:hypothetical protein BH23ACT4_BH23ACT4_03580 [soil metagenome]
MRSRIQIPATLIVLILAAAGCGMPTTALSGEAAPDNSAAVETVETTKAPNTGPVETKKTDPTKTESSKAEKKADFECPVTIPPQPGFVATEPENVTYSEHFPAPDPWPSEYPHEGEVWYGTEELWTALAVDGDHGVRKSVWWSINFPGGMVEEQPDVSVTWTRLDTKEPVVIDNGGDATNAFIPEQGWFIIAGIDPAEAGCWEVEATYEGATLSYIYEK